MSAGKNWTPEEVAYLEESWGMTSIPTIANKLGRSVEAVTLKAYRLGLGRHIHSGTRITLVQLCKALGNKNFYNNARTRWIPLGLPVRYQRVIDSKFAMIDIDDFWEWAEKNKDIIDFSHMEAGALGREPAWVKEARRARATEKLKTSPWTKDEDNKLRRMLKTGRYSYNDLSAALMRTEGAIKRRISTLSLTERPIKRPCRDWTEEEIDTMLRLRDAGHSWEAIGQKLDRSALAVRGRYDRLINPDYCKRAYRRRRAAARKDPGSVPAPEWTPIRSKTPGELLKERNKEEEK